MTCQVQGDSREAVAFGLMQCVLFAAGRANNDHPFPAGSTLLRGERRVHGGGNLGALCALPEGGAGRRTDRRAARQPAGDGGATAFLIAAGPLRVILPDTPAGAAGAGGATMNEALPIAVLTGFLGSGKTTLLRRVLASPAMATPPWSSTSSARLGSITCWSRRARTTWCSCPMAACAVRCGRIWFARCTGC